MKQNRLPVGLLAEDPANPRKITAKRLRALGVSLETFGDLSGIVWNEEIGMLVAGHQRMKELRELGAEDWVRTGDDAGYVEHPKTKERFAIRIVRWDLRKHRMAMLVANSPEVQGEFTDEAADQLQALAAEGDNAALMEALRLDALLEDLGGGEGSDGEEFDDADALEEFDATPRKFLTWIMIEAPEDAAAEIEGMLRGRFANDSRVRIERSSTTRERKAVLDG